MNTTRFDGLVRPLVTLTLVGAQIALAYFWTAGAVGAEKAFAALSPFTSMALIFWFRSRDEASAVQATVAAVQAVVPTPPPPLDAPPPPEPPTP